MAEEKALPAWATPTGTPKTSNTPAKGSKSTERTTSADLTGKRINSRSQSISGATNSPAPSGKSHNTLKHAASTIADTNATAGEKAQEVGAIAAETAAKAAVSAVASPVAGEVAGKLVGKTVRSKKGRYFLTTMVALPMIGMLIVPTVLAGLITSIASSGDEETDGTNQCSPSGSGISFDTSTPTTAWTQEQLDNATTIINTTIQSGLTARDATIAVMTAITESSLINVMHGDAVGPDSIGLFQQRDPWGSLEERTNPAKATQLFLNALTSPHLKVYKQDIMVNDYGRHSLEPWIVAQAVQRSAYDTGSNYQTNYAKAAELVTAATGEEQPVPWSGSDGTTGEYTPTLPGECVIPPGFDGSVGADGAITPTLSKDGTYLVSPQGALSGQLPPNVICTMPAPNASYSIRCNAQPALLALMDEYTKQFGQEFVLVSGYRTYAQQVQVAIDKGSLAAKPGTSNHGWGLAIDISSATHGGVSSAKHAWLRENAPKYGWSWPSWAQPGGKFEPWHWEFVGIANATSPSSTPTN